MKFDPNGSLLPKGNYRYQVIKAEDRVSGAGNEYTSLILKVWNADGREGSLFTNMSLIKLLKHFCDVNNMMDEYKSGNIEPHQFVGKSGGLVSIDIEPEKPNPNGGTYDAKNRVVDYIHGSLEPAQVEPANDFHDDPLPF